MTRRAYVLCGTPRSGSTMLCRMLAATGVAGNPNSYFRAVDVADWAAAWGVDRPTDTEADGFDRRHVAALVREAGAGTGVVGLRLMWDSVDEAVRRLARALDVTGDVTGGVTGDLAALIERAFGPTLFVHLTRRDKVAQAVSWLRAEQGGVWHRAADGSVLEGTPSPAPLAYDGARLGALVDELRDHDAAWAAFLAARGIAPLRLAYEDAAADPTAALRAILAGLGLDVAAADGVPVRTARLADALSTEWAARFRAERGA